MLVFYQSFCQILIKVLDIFFLDKFEMGFCDPLGQQIIYIYVRPWDNKGMLYFVPFSYFYKAPG